MSTDIIPKQGHVILSLGDRDGGLSVKEQYEREKGDGKPVYLIVLHGSEIGIVKRGSPVTGDVEAQAKRVNQVFQLLGPGCELSIIAHSSPYGNVFQFDNKLTSSGSGLCGPLSNSERKKHFTEVVDFISDHVKQENFTEAQPLRLSLLSCYGARGGMQSLAAKVQRCFMERHHIPTQVAGYTDGIYLAKKGLFTIPDLWSLWYGIHVNADKIPEERQAILRSTTKAHILSIHDGKQVDEMTRSTRPIVVEEELTPPLLRMKEKMERLEPIFDLCKSMAPTPDAAKAVTTLRATMMEYYYQQFKQGFPTSHIQQVEAQLEITLHALLQGDPSGFKPLIKLLDELPSGSAREGFQRCYAHGIVYMPRIFEYSKNAALMRHAFTDKMKENLEIVHREFFHTAIPKSSLFGRIFKCTKKDPGQIETSPNLSS